jgi:hypothetical protein
LFLYFKTVRYYSLYLLLVSQLFGWER